MKPVSFTCVCVRSLAAVLLPLAATEASQASGDFLRLWQVMPGQQIPEGAILTGWAIARDAAVLSVALGGVGDQDVVEAQADPAAGRYLEVRLQGIEPLSDAQAGGRARRLLEDLLAAGRHPKHGGQRGGPVVCIAHGELQEDRLLAVCGTGHPEEGARDFGLALLQAGLAAVEDEQIANAPHPAGHYRGAEARAREAARGDW